MNRIIKFRAWDKHQGYFLEDGGIRLDGDGKLYEYDSLIDEWIFNPHLVLSLWTGLKDKNGKDIYESDLVKEGKKVFKVFWNDLGSGSWWFSSYTKDKEWLHVSKVNVSQLEVIGNIYKNKDLLK